MLTIHRGTNEIGGSCIELWNDNTRIVLDLGMPLVDKDRKEFNFKSFEKMSVDELIKNSILPDIPGLYKDDSKKVNALIISHPHADHFGLMNYVKPEVPVFMGEATHDIIQISGIFTPNTINFTNVQFFKRDVIFKIGDFTITPFWNDHSAFDSYSLLIECDCKRILYTGDFRSHGRKSKIMERFMAHPPPDVDYLIMEGTQLGRTQVISKSEEDIEKELLVKFKEYKINLINTSGQNIDRLVSIFKACQKARKTLVIDVYIAKLLKTLSKYAKFPYPSPSFAKIKVFFSEFTCSRLVKYSHDDILNEFEYFKVNEEEINDDPANYVMIVRPSMLVDIERIKNIANGNFIYSMWEGYKDKPDTIKLIDYLKKKGFSMFDIHTSGHADSESLLKFANAINPKNIIPIHTFSKDKYRSFFSHNIICLNDKQVLEL